jgi:hypothetical protein
MFFNKLMLTELVSLNLIMCGLLTRISPAVGLLVMFMQVVAYGQTMQGQIMDITDNKPLEDVVVSNVYSETADNSDKDGKFSIAVAAGQLVEFKKGGYKVIRIRVPQGKLPNYFKVGMERYTPGVPNFENNASPDYKTDSLKYALLYKRELEHPRLTGLDIIRHPFSAMSKKTQQIWAFQDEYSMYQQQKFIDYTFNDKLIASLTGLTGDSLIQYKQLFRPTYEQLRSMTEYTFLNYIKRTVLLYRQHGIRARMSPQRSTR